VVVPLAVDRPDGPDGPVTPDASAPLTPIQRRFFDDHPHGPDRYAMSMHVELAPGTDPAILGRALAALVERHEALRTRYHRLGGTWVQERAAGAPGGLLTVVDADDAEAAVDAAADALRLDSGVLLRAVLVRLGADTAPRLFLTAHHLAVDGVSWRILLADLATAYAGLTAGDGPGLPAPTTSYQRWAIRLQERTLAGGFDGELTFWRALRPTTELPREGVAANTFGTATVSSVRLDRMQTAALLQDVPPVYRTRINDVLLAALGRVLAEWAGGPVTVTLEGHGREDIGDDAIDLSRTVGWFTTAYPVELDVPERDWGAALKAVKERLRAIPERGLGYGALRHLTEPDDPRRLAPPPVAPQVGLNYLGQWDGSPDPTGLVRRLLPSIGRDQDPDLPRPHLIDVLAAVRDGELQVDWVHSPANHSTATVEELAARFRGALLEIVDHCRAPGSGGATPSDFPLAGLDQQAVDRVVGDGRAVADVYPLTPMQAGMLFHTLADPTAPTYLEQLTYVLDGLAEPDLLATAWQVVAEHVEVLRGRVVWEQVERPLMVIERSVRLPVRWLDWRQLPAAEQRAALAEHLAQARRHGVDLATAPLMRLTLIRLTDTTVQVVCYFHHLVLDGWSLFQVLAAVHSAVAALAAGRRPELPARSPFRAYVEWLHEQDLTAARSYWRDRLAGFTTPHPRCPTTSGRGPATGPAPPATCAPACRGR
jgi:non-ribosomal peptide synthase protein (TIGR01720 family)